MKLCHVTIQTEQFETELNFYLRYAGLNVQRDLRPMGRTMVFLADAAGDTEIEIIEKPNASNAGNANLSIGFIADNADEIRRQLADDGYQPGPFISPDPSVRFFFVTDPAGVTVQFLKSQG